MYHRVIPSVNAEKVFVQPGMYVTVDNFRRQVAFLKENFHVLPLKQIIDRIRIGKNLSGYCAITFDDGWHDNFTHAFPILQEFGLPATVFLSTGFIGTDRLFWPEEISFYLKQFGGRNLQFQTLVLKRFAKEILRNDYENILFDNTIQALKTWSPQDREEVIEYLRANTNRPKPERLLMNWEEVREMHSVGLINFGAHTVNHVILDQVSPQQAEKEIVNSIQDLEKHLGAKPNFFAYPNGNFNNILKSILKRYGFTGALTTQKGWLRSGEDLFAIPRIGMHEDVSKTISIFLARLLFKRF